ncbi:MAG: hypothetical protein KIT33_09920 [Candidatus Kapabacteria bacterium]|nr:hypothetical protein [Ignavibacteriota bacterium]MCW5885274.1 hypothetical protein [Candidatus Kapabacteria bacterium]
MLKNTYIKLYLFILISILATNVSFSQDVRDTLAFIKVYDSKLLDKQTLEFDLYIERNSEKWIKFVNGTFTLSFDDTLDFKISPENIRINQTRTELRQDVAPGNNLPTNGYRTDFQIYDDRVTITILGPENFDNCETVELDKPVLLGTYVVSTTEPKLPDYRMRWKEPYDYYQACAFKIEEDSLFNQNTLLYGGDDNISMEDETSITYVFVNDTIRRQFILDYFRAEYLGQLNSQYYWQTVQEYDILGYSVYRGVRTPFLGTDEDITFDRLIGTWRPGDKFNPEFIVDSNNPKPQRYAMYPDDLEFRGGDYCYALYGSFLRPDGNVVDSLLATDCLTVPRSVISFAEASPEVFSYETTITYTVDDDVYLSVYVADLLGKRTQPLITEHGIMNRVEVRKGTYSFIFRAPELSSQGFYNIRFTALPINDISVEESRADVKLQLIK